MPDIEPRDLPGARGREHPSQAKGQQASCHAAAVVAGFCAGTSGYELAPRRAGEGRVFEELGLPRRFLPRRIYYGVVGNQKRYFALKLPLAVEPEIVTFAYVDPGHQTDRELYSWGAAHGPLWDALRKKGRQVRVLGIAAENATLDRTARVLERWAAAKPGTSDEVLTAKLELKAIDDAMTHKDENFLAQYGGFAKAARRSAELQGWGLTPEQEIKAIEDAMERNDLGYLERRYGGRGPAMKRAAALMRMSPEAKAGVSIDDYSTWRAVRFADRDEVG